MLAPGCGLLSQPSVHGAPVLQTLQTNTPRKRLLEYTGPGSLWAKILIFIYKNINKHFECKNKRSNEWSTIIQHWVWLNGTRDMKAKILYHLPILSNYIIITTIYTIYIKTLADLACPQWTRGPDFLQLPLDWWPTMPAATDTEADKGCQTQKVHLGIALEAEWPNIPEPTQFHTWWI